MKSGRSWQFSHVIIERLIVGDGGSLKGVSTGCVDVVVTTRSLCSVKSVQSTLQEIRRVLAPVRLIYIYLENVDCELKSKNFASCNYYKSKVNFQLVN